MDLHHHRLMAIDIEPKLTSIWLYQVGGMINQFTNEFCTISIACILTLHCLLLFLERAFTQLSGRYLPLTP